jgi:hypothetical protein
MAEEDTHEGAREWSESWIKGELEEAYGEAMMDKLGLGARGHARPVTSDELGVSEEQVTEINRDRKALVEQVDKLMEQINPVAVKEMWTRDKNLEDALPEIRLASFEQAARHLTVGEGENKKTLQLKWGATGDPTNPGTLQKDEKGEWFLLLDESLKDENSGNLFSEVMHEYGAWALLVGAGVGEKANIKGAVIGRNEQGQLHAYKTTHVFDSIYRAYKPIS